MTTTKQKNQNAEQNYNQQENVNDQFGNGEALYRFHPQYGFVPCNGNPQFTQNAGAGQPGFYHNFSAPHNPYHAGPHGFGGGMHGMPYGAYGQPHQAMQAQVDFLTQQLMQLQQLQANNPFFQAQSNGQGNFKLEDMNKIYNTVDDVMNGKASPNKLFGLLQGISGDFWKGFAIGVGILLLYNYSPLKDMLASSLGGLLANFGQNGQDFTDFDDDMEENQTEKADLDTNSDLNTEK